MLCYSRIYLKYSVVYFVLSQHLYIINAILPEMIDTKDRKILFELSKNCRIATTQLAKKVGLSQQTVDYRIKRLLKQKIIKSFITEIDIQKLAYERHIMYIQLKRIDEKKEEEILEYLVNHQFLTWVVTSTGKWSIILDIIAKDIQHVNSIVEGIKEKYGKYLGEYIIAPQIKYEFYNSKYYGFKEEKNNSTAIEKYTPDEIDLKLLKILSNNARMELMQLSQKIHVASNTVKNRIKKLIESKIIKSFFVEPDKTALGYEQYNIQFMFENIDKEKEKQLMSYIKNHPNINFYYKPIGYWDLEIGVFVKNPGELRKIILEIRNTFADYIKIVDTVVFYEESKNNYIPEGVFNPIDPKSSSFHSELLCKPKSFINTP